MVFDLALTDITCCRGQEVVCSCAALEDLFIHRFWRPSEVIGFANKHVQEQKQEVNVTFLYHERQIRAIKFWFKVDVCLNIIYDTIAATQDAFGEKWKDSSAGAIVGLQPGAAGREKERDWDFGDMAADTFTGREQTRMVLDII